MAETFLYLTTVGRTTGNPHQIEIWYVAHKNCYYLCSEHREESHWVKNLRIQPQVSFYVAERGQAVPIIQGVARPLDPEKDHDLLTIVRALFDEKYQWNDGLMVEICPLPDDTRIT